MYCRWLRTDDGLEKHHFPEGVLLHVHKKNKPQVMNKLLTTFGNSNNLTYICKIKYYKMEPNKRYQQFLMERFEKELMDFEIYYNDDLKSWWWINPNTKEWKFEMEESGTLWWFYDWGVNFREKMGMEDDEFKSLISDYVQQTLSKCLNVDKTTHNDGKIDTDLITNSYPSIEPVTHIREEIIEKTVDNGENNCG